MNKTKILVVLILVAMCFFATFSVVISASENVIKNIRRGALPIGGGEEPTGGGDPVNAGAANPGIPK